MIRQIDFSPLAEFVDRTGIVRPIYGCSLLGRFEFVDRQEQITQMLDGAASDQTWQQMYIDSKPFANAVNRCLALNGIDPDWLTPTSLEQLLFVRTGDDGEWQAGWLTELNTRESKAVSASSDSIESTLPNLLAVLSLNCDSLTEAIELASGVPANLLLDVMDARVELSKTPEQKNADEQAANMASLKNDYASLIGK